MTRELSLLGEPDIASTAALIGHPSRAAMLAALLDGRALPAGELARAASITAQTASTHLEKLLEGNLVNVEAQGRHRYYRLSSYAVADLLESLAVVSPGPPPSRTDELALGRTCYGHLAGRLGVAITESLIGRELIEPGMLPTPAGVTWFGDIGIEVAAIKRAPLAKPCLDWSERRHHLAGALGVALATRMFQARWIARARVGRAVRLTVEGRRELQARLGLALDF